MTNYVCTNIVQKVKTFQINENVLLKPQIIQNFLFMRECKAWFPHKKAFISEMNTRLRLDYTTK